MQRLLDGLILVGLIIGVYYFFSPAFRMWAHTKPRVQLVHLPKLFEDGKRPVMTPIVEGLDRIGVRASTKHLDIEYRCYRHKGKTTEIIDVTAKYVQGADIRIENGVVTQLRFVGGYGTPQDEELTQESVDNILVLCHYLRLYRTYDDTLDFAQLALR